MRHDVNAYSVNSSYSRTHGDDVPDPQIISSAGLHAIRGNCVIGEPAHQSLLLKHVFVVMPASPLSVPTPGYLPVIKRFKSAGKSHVYAAEGLPIHCQGLVILKRTPTHTHKVTYAAFFPFCHWTPFNCRLMLSPAHSHTTLPVNPNDVCFSLSLVCQRKEADGVRLLPLACLPAQIPHSWESGSHAPRRPSCTRVTSNRSGVGRWGA